MLDDWTTADVPPRTHAALSLLEAMTKRPLEIDGAFLASLAEQGLEEPALRQVANIGFHYNLINRVADAFDFELPSGAALGQLAGMLNLAGRVLTGSQADSVWVRSGDGRIRPTEVELGRERLLTAPGATEPALRRAIEANVVGRWGVQRPQAPPIPDELDTYLERLALYAFTIEDETVEALRARGHTDDTLYEITMVGALAAALVGIEQVFGALYDD